MFLFLQLKISKPSEACKSPDGSFRCSYPHALGHNMAGDPKRTNSMGFEVATRGLETHVLEYKWTPFFVSILIKESSESYQENVIYLLCR